MSKQKRLVTPKVYEVGADVSPELIAELQIKLADWFVESRPSSKEPAALARQKIKDCLEGKTSEGQPWFAAANSTFETRVKMACRFDVATMDGIRSADEKSKERKDRAKARDAKRKLDAREDANIPDELRKDLKNTAKYGDNPNVFLSSEEHKNWQRLKDDYQRQFPELREINAEAELNMLCDLLIVQERQRFKFLKGERVDAIDMKGITDQITNLKKALGIHPDQLAKRSKEAQGATVAEIIARLESMKDAKDQRDKYFVEELLMIFQMYHQPSPRQDMGGYQLDDIGLFGLTRCRTCVCPRCGSRNYVGINIDEIEEYLAGKGVLDIESPITQHIASDTEETAEELEAPPHGTVA